MFEIYDIVRANDDCIAQEIAGREGLVIEVDKFDGTIHVVFNGLDYIVIIPKRWVHKWGSLCCQDRNSHIEHYLPGCYMYMPGIHAYCEIESLEFACILSKDDYITTIHLRNGTWIGGSLLGEVRDLRGCTRKRLCR